MCCVRMFVWNIVFLSLLIKSGPVLLWVTHHLCEQVVLLYLVVEKIPEPRLHNCQYIQLLNYKIYTLEYHHFPMSYMEQYCYRNTQKGICI